MKQNRVVSREEWTAARKQLMVKEKELTLLQDKLSAERRNLPWELVEEPYVFDGPDGPVTLADLFDGCSQLIIYHFMLAPDWKEGCVGCSFLADHLDGARLHLVHHDVNVVVVSRAPWSQIETYRKRMGWRFPWVSSNRNEFNFDYHVSFRTEEMKNGKVYYNYELQDFQSEELPGVSVFYCNEAGQIFHTYSAYSRGPDALVGAFHYLDITPKGRNEMGPNFDLRDWVRHHDKYEDAEAASCCGSKPRK